MTNEEKVQEICDKMGFQNQPYLKATYREEVEQAIEEGMQWKDKQIDTILLTTEGCLRSFFESQGNTQESIDNFIDALKIQINENINKL